MGGRQGCSVVFSPFVCFAPPLFSEGTASAAEGKKGGSASHFAGAGRRPGSSFLGKANRTIRTPCASSRGAAPQFGVTTVTRWPRPASARASASTLHSAPPGANGGKYSLARQTFTAGAPRRHESRWTPLAAPPRRDAFSG